MNYGNNCLWELERCGNDWFKHNSRVLGFFLWQWKKESIYVDRVCVGVHVFVIHNVPDAWRFSQVIDKPAPTFTKSAQIYTFTNAVEPCTKNQICHRTNSPSVLEGIVGEHDDQHCLKNLHHCSGLCKSKTWLLWLHYFIHSDIDNETGWHGGWQ